MKKAAGKQRHRQNRPDRRAKAGGMNRKYKDSLFRMLFSDKASLLSLYNAVNGTSYQDPEELEFTTIENAIYMGIKNDLSFLIDSFMNLYEAQSTFNPNMPLRGLFYLSQIYQGYVNARGLDIYGSRRVKLPMPRYLVFYNGTKQEPDRQTIALSEAYERSGEEAPCLECRATLINSNVGQNKKLRDDCRILYEYAMFVDLVRRCWTEMRGNLEDAVDMAVRESIKKGILADFLKKHRAEVKDVILTEYDQEAHIRNEKNESWQEGLQKGRREGWEKGSRSVLRQVVLYHKGEGMSSEKIVEILQNHFRLNKEEAENCLWELDFEETPSGGENSDTDSV